MTRIAAIYDIHGNLPALEAVLDAIRASGVDEIVVGGDVVPGPMARETLDCLLGLDTPTRFIRGNGDREVLARMRGVETDSVPERFRSTMRWVAEQLGPEHERALGAWPTTVRITVDGVGDVLFCHATPDSDTAIFTARTPDERLVAIFGDLDAKVVVCGHTHMQCDRTIGRLRIVNAGSVGMPFGEPGAYWALIGPAIELRKTRYDLTRAAERIRATAYPQAAEFAARNVLQPPSEQMMLDAFTSAG